MLMLAAFYFISFCSMLDFELTFLPSTLNTFLTRHSICRQDVSLASFFGKLLICKHVLPLPPTVVQYFFVFDTICCSDSVCSRIGVALLLFDISLSFHC